jgi:hypothetical protein
MIKSTPTSSKIKSNDLGNGKKSSVTGSKVLGRMKQNGSIKQNVQTCKDSADEELLRYKIRMQDRKNERRQEDDNVTK